jgi:hypothetical protein
MEKRLFEYETPQISISVLIACSCIIAASGDDADPLKLPGTTFDDFIIP